MFSKLGGAKVFSTIDLRSGYYHIGLTRESRAKSAFVVPMGKWEFKCTPFGLSQAPAYFQLLIDKVLMGCSNFAMGYLDDIIIFSKSEEEHLQHLEEIFLRLRKFGLKMKREKCSFFKKHIQYLGHLVSEQGFEPLPEKLKSIKDMPALRTLKEVKQFLGLIGYYRKFVPRFADISRPLTKPPTIKKFLNKRTMNSKVNNWAVELEQFKLHLDWIPGSRNLLADSLSCLLDINPDANQTNEPPGHDFGSYCFEELQPVQVLVIVNTEVIELVEECSEERKHSRDSRKQSNIRVWKTPCPHSEKPQGNGSDFGEDSQNSRAAAGMKTFEIHYSEKPSISQGSLYAGESREHSQNLQAHACVEITEHEDVKEITLPLKPKQLQELQKNDSYCREVAKKLHKDVEL